MGRGERQEAFVPSRQRARARKQQRLPGAWSKVYVRVWRRRRAVRGPAPGAGNKEDVTRAPCPQKGASPARCRAGCGLQCRWGAQNRGSFLFARAPPSSPLSFHHCRGGWEGGAVRLGGSKLGAALPSARPSSCPDTEARVGASVQRKAARSATVRKWQRPRGSLQARLALVHSPSQAQQWANHA